MIRSMTGFGDASRQVQGVHYLLEVRSLNNRYFKALLRLPEELSGLEAELESRLRKRIHRGSVTLTVKMRFSDAEAAHRVNDAALMQYLDHLETLQERVAGRDHKVSIDLTELLVLPGVLQPVEDEQSLMNRARPVLFELLDQACDRLTTMRVTEGEGIAGDLLEQQKVIRDRITLAQARIGQVVDQYHQRLRSRVNEMLAEVGLELGEGDLIRELAIFAERADISEELSRLTGHLDQFEQILRRQDGQPAGRTLDFLAQELLREANTIASKASDVEIARAVVEVKGAIDRIKEQVQNVE